MATNLVFPGNPCASRFIDTSLKDYNVQEFKPDAGPSSRILLSTVGGGSGLSWLYEAISARQVLEIIDFWDNKTFGTFKSFKLNLATFRQFGLNGYEVRMITELATEWKFKEKPKVETILSNMYKVTVSVELDA